MRAGGFPPPVRTYRVLYDYPNRRARIDEFAEAGRAPARVGVKRYDLAFEFEVRELLARRSCRKSRVREAMPPPLLPRSLVYMGADTVSAAPRPRPARATATSSHAPRPFFFAPPARSRGVAAASQVRGIAADRWRDVRGAGAGRGAPAQPAPGAAAEDVDAYDWLGVELGDEVVDLWFASAQQPGASAAGASSAGAPAGSLLRIRSETVARASPAVGNATDGEGEGAGGARAAASGAAGAWDAVRTLPLMTWDLLELRAGAHAASEFTVAGAAGAAVFSAESDADGAFARAAQDAAGGTPPRLIPGGLNVSGCERLPLDIGFPYSHILHAYVYA